MEKLINLQTFADFNRSAAEAGVFFYYSGEFTSAVVQAAADSLKHRMTEEETSGPKRRKVFSTFIEMAHNILHYGLEASQVTTAKLGAISVGRSNDGVYWIACANKVDISHVPRISEKLQSIQNMTHDEIKQNYKQQLLNDEHKEQDEISKGAGLGFLTIARDSTEPIEFHFTSDPDNPVTSAYFFIKAVI